MVIPFEEVWLRNRKVLRWSPASFIRGPPSVTDTPRYWTQPIHAKGNGGKKGDGGYDEIIAQALEQVGLPADFAEVAHTEEYDEKLREYHHNGISSVGDEVGTPVIKLGDTAFFGPVITRVPKGEEAGELFDASVRLAQFPYFFELKRSRTEMPQVEED